MNYKLIKIRVRSNSSINNRGFHVIIWDNQKKIVFDDYTIDGFVCFKAIENCVYKIMVINTLKIKKVVTFLVTEKMPLELTIILSDYYIKKPHLITIELTDHFYKGLPILKGKMILWST